MDRNAFSYVLLIISALGSFLHLSVMTYAGKFTFTYLGMIFIMLYGLVAFSEYDPLSLEDLQEMESSGRPAYEINAQSNNRNLRVITQIQEDGQILFQYRQFSPSRHHHMSSHRFMLDDIQPNCIPMHSDEISSGAEPSFAFAVLEFCAFLLCCSFFTTDLLFAYQIFSAELNYLPLLGGLMSIFVGMFLGDARHSRDLYIFAIPANCWGQIYYAGFKHNNLFAMVAGYLFFVAYYYNDIQRIYKKLTPQAQSNYFLSSYCVLASLALEQAYKKFDFKRLKA